MLQITVKELAEKLGVRVEGEGGDAMLRGVADLENAGPGQLAFAGGAKYFAAAVASEASAVLVPEGAELPGTPKATLLRAADVGHAFITACGMFAPPEVKLPAGVDARAAVSPEAKLGEGVHVGAFAVVEAGAEIGDGTVLYPHTYVGHGAKIGAGCKLYPFAMVREFCVLGDRVILHGGAAIGADGFGYEVDAAGVRTKIPQVGIVVLEDDVEIGANACVDRARFGETRIQKGTKIDNLVQIAHNCVIGEHSVMCAQVGMAGTCTVGNHVILAGQVGLAGHLKVGDWAVVGAQSGVPKSLPGAQMYLGSPALPGREFGKQVAMVNGLPKLRERVKELEAKVAALEGRGEGG